MSKVAASVGSAQALQRHGWRTQPGSALTEMDNLTLHKSRTSLIMVFYLAGWGENYRKGGDIRSKP